MRVLTWLSLGTALTFATPVSAGVVYSEDFTGETDGAVPSSNGIAWFDGLAATNTGSVVAVSTSTGNAAPSLAVVDTTSASDYVSLNFGVAAFSPFNMTAPEHAVFTVAFDFRADAFATTNASGSTIRLALKDNTRYFTFGIARGLVDNDSYADVFLYAGDSGTASNFTSIGADQAIGLSGGTLDPVVDFGAYNTTDAAQNGTDGWYRIELTFTQASTSVGIRATRLADNASYATTKTVSSPYSFANTGSDGITVLAPGGSTGTGYFDNIQMATTPEPATLSLLALGGLTLARRRRI